MKSTERDMKQISPLIFFNTKGKKRQIQQQIFSFPSCFNTVSDFPEKKIGCRQLGKLLNVALVFCVTCVTEILIFVSVFFP